MFQLQCFKKEDVSDLSARNDDVLAPVLDSNVAVWVHHSQITRREIATTKSFASSLGVVEVLFDVNINVFKIAK